MRVIFATGNKDKIRELKEIMEGTGIEVFTAKECGLSTGAEENGDTFAANAEIKALDIYSQLKKKGEEADTLVMADDSGLCIDFLDGQPGVYSSRFLGEDTSYSIKNPKIIDMLSEAEPGRRGAHYVCDICLVEPSGRVMHEEGRMSGSIAYKEAGRGGFGYDPIFYLDDRGCTAAELSPEAKNAISHRGSAMRKMLERIKKEGII